MNNPLISVIVPIYKVEKYLRECIESIISQSYVNLEIILIDDGSPDLCPIICDEYAEKDIRVKVIHKENGGVSSARNSGLRIASGEYIGWVDPDDYIDKKMFECMLKLLIENDADISVCSVNYFGNNEGIINYGDTILCRHEYLKLLLSNKIQSFLCNKLFRADLFDKIEFPVGDIYEDVMVQHLIAEKADRVVTTSDIFYYYRQRTGQITQCLGESDFLSLFSAVQSRSKYYVGTEYYPYAVYNEFVVLRDFIYQFDTKSKRINIDEKRKIRKMLWTCFFLLSKKERIVGLCLMCFPRSFLKIRKIMINDRIS